MHADPDGISIFFAPVMVCLGRSEGAQIALVRNRMQTWGEARIMVKAWRIYRHPHPLSKIDNSTLTSPQATEELLL